MATPAYLPRDLSPLASRGPSVVPATGAEYLTSLELHEGDNSRQYQLSCFRAPPKPGYLGTPKPPIWTPSGPILCLISRESDPQKWSF